MTRWTTALIFPVFIILVFAFTGCDSGGGGSSDTIVSYAGSEPVGDFVVIKFNKAEQKVRRINYTNFDDSGWLDYTDVDPADAEGFSMLKRVDLESGDYVIFAEFLDTAVVYQMFDSLDDPIGWPVYVVLRKKVNKSMYSEKAYNWIKMKIDDIPNNSEMEAGFAAFDTFVSGSVDDVGLLYGAGYNSYDDAVNDINTGDVAKISEFTANTQLVANTMWTGTPDGLNNAITLTGTASGTNILDFGPGAGGGMGLAIPQSDVTLAEAAGTYFVLCYENNKDANAGSGSDTVTPIKVVISASSPHIQVFPYTERTDGTYMLSDDLKALEDLLAAESPGGSVAINAQFATESGISGARSISTEVQNAYLCHGVFLAIDPGNYVLTVSFDPLGNYFGFTMFDNTTDEIIRFGFGIKDAGYADL